MPNVETAERMSYARRAHAAFFAVKAGPLPSGVLLLGAMSELGAAAFDLAGSTGDPVATLIAPPERYLVTTRNTKLFMQGSISDFRHQEIDFHSKRLLARFGYDAKLPLINCRIAELSGELLDAKLRGANLRAELLRDLIKRFDALHLEVNSVGIRNDVEMGSGASDFLASQNELPQRKKTEWIAAIFANQANAFHQLGDYKSARDSLGEMVRNFQQTTKLYGGRVHECLWVDPHYKIALERVQGRGAFKSFAAELEMSIS